MTSESNDSSTTTAMVASNAAESTSLPESKNIGSNSDNINVADEVITPDEIHRDDVVLNDDDASIGGSTSSDTKSFATTTSDVEKEQEKNQSEEISEDPSTLLLRALTHKEEGNAHFQSKDLPSAIRSYRKGTNLLKPLNKSNTGDEQVKSLLVTLYTNLSMATYQQEKHSYSKDFASKALEVDENNVKALYRRGLACKALGNLETAKDDLKKAYGLDSANAAVKRELAFLKKELANQKAKEKARLAKAFSNKSSSLLYSDKEEEEARKERELKERKLAEKKKLEEWKKEWEDECVERMSKGDDAISFEEWEKKRKEKEEEEEKEKQRKKKIEEEKKKEERRKERERARVSSSGNGNGDKSYDEEDSDEELTEKELAMLRGYKKTSDGRTTSYFTREQTEDEKKLIGCIAPKRLDSTADGGAGASCPSPSSGSEYENINMTTPFGAESGNGNITSSVGSAWNKSGTTWEEKDTTDWCKSCLVECLRSSTFVYAPSASGNSNSDSSTSTYTASVKQVENVTGDASVALAGGKKRYIYDFHVEKIRYEIRKDQAGMEGDATDGDIEMDTTVAKVVASGTLKLPDINSAATSEEELEVDVFAWKKSPTSDIAEDVRECRRLFVQDVRKSVLKFVEKFNASF
ncbi:hypothetical protein ACHAXS_009445 [Conticribra weissflogii]